MEFLRNDTVRPTAKDVLAGQIEQSYRQLPIALVVTVVNGLILAFVLGEVVNPKTILFWLLILFSVTVGRYALLRAYQDPRRRARTSNQAWRRSFVLGACATGIVWGAAGIVLFHPHSFPHQVFLAFVLGGMVAGAIPFLSAVENAYPFFAVPVMFPITFEMLAQGDRIHLIMGMMTLIFGLAMLASAAQVQRVFRDSVELRLKLVSSIETSQTLQQMVHLDELTGIANRRLFEQRLDEEWRRAQRDGSALSLITADIDYFKAYNDHYGHPAGDRCLITAAGSMASVMSRSGDLAARIGGEEFAFLLPGTSLKGAALIAERIRKGILDLKIPHEASSVDDQVTVSLGVSCLDSIAGASCSELLRASDAALYEAKRRGRNQVTYRPVKDPLGKAESAA